MNVCQPVTLLFNCAYVYICCYIYSVLFTILYQINFNDKHYFFQLVVGEFLLLIAFVTHSSPFFLCQYRDNVDISFAITTIR